MFGMKITGIGCCVPERVFTNADVSEILISRLARARYTDLIKIPYEFDDQFKTDPQWIETRTGIKERRFAAAHEATSDLATRAAEAALKNAGLAKEALQFIIVATTTPDHQATPPTAALVQHKLGIPARNQDGSLREVAVFDVSVACSSFVKALALAYGLIQSGLYKTGLVIGADVMSRIVSWNDRAIFPLLGDGAGCFVLEQTGTIEDQFGPNNFYLGVDGSLADLIVVPAGGSRRAVTPENLTDPLDQSHTIKMKGRKVFEIVLGLVADKIIPEALKKANIGLESIDAIVFHQANLRIIGPVVKRLGYSGIVHNNIERYGNTTSASIPLCLDEALELGKIKSGMRVLMVVFGGGFTWGTALWRCEL